ncbi:Na+/H+ antiporter NhaC family protein [Paenibacillus turpanensis]|uniref:Na+/H+ antiporter NhaC family protein n=1 Tax=Paenibacillus turpanensis TaxID=2689078 RepID=UPI00140E4DB0|nr:Na+/H+ antiporter NhaC family protein [Paenibacillus turpanensis]
MVTAWQLGFVVFLTIAGLAAAYVTNAPLAAGFALGLIALVLLVRRSGLAEWGTIGRSMRSGAAHTKEVIYILLLVGLLIPSWTASGTIPYLISSGLSLLHPAYFVTGSFVLSAVISMLLGTSTGTLSAVGIPLIGAAAYLGIPLPLVAGALVSGAFVGDRGSPFSSAHQLVAASTGVTVRAQQRSMLPTTLTAIAFCLVVFGSFDAMGGWGSSSGAIRAADELREAFVLGPLLLIPAVVLVGSILLFRLKTRTAFLWAIGISVILGSMVQGVPIGDWPVYLWSGYEHATLAHLHSKGLSDMVGLVILIAMAGAFSGILEDTQLIRPYVEKLFGQTAKQLSATLRTGGFGLALGLVSCTQTLPIMMTGRMFLPLWKERFPAVSLSRVVADTSLVFAAMVPWNMLAILCSTILGVSVEQYVPYAVFLWILPLATLVVSGLSSMKGERSHTAAAPIDQMK